MSCLTIECTVAPGDGSRCWHINGLTHDELELIVALVNRYGPLGVRAAALVAELRTALNKAMKDSRSIRLDHPMNPL